MNKFIGKYISIILGIAVFWLGIVPFFFSRAIPVVCENITYNSDYKIEMQSPKLILNILPTAIVKADKLKITKKESKEFVFIDNPKLKIRLLPLLSGMLHINKFSASNLEFYINLPDNPQLDKDFFVKLENAKFNFDAFNLEKFSVKMENKEKPIVFEGKNTIYRKNSRYIKFFTDSRVKLQEKQSDIFVNLFLPRNNDVKNSNIDIKLTNFDIKPICDFFKNYLPSDLKDVTGIININVDKNNLTAQLKDVSVIKKDDANSMYFPSDIYITSDFDLTRKIIYIKNADVKSKNISTSLSGTLTNYLDKRIPNLDINLRINNSRIEDFISMMPPIQTEDIDGYKLKKYKFYGDVIGNLNIKGDMTEPSIVGNMYITDGILTKPIPNAKGASIKLKFLGKYLNFDVVVPAGTAEKVWVKGGVELYNVKYSDMHIWSTKNVNLEIAEEKIIPIHEILKFIIGPVPIMDIKGQGNIDINVKGNRKDPHIWGVFNVKNVKTFFRDTPDLLLSDANAVITFDDDNAVFQMSEGYINKSPVKISGLSNIGGKFDFDIEASKQEVSYLYKAIMTSNMVDEIKYMLPKLDIITGFVNLKLKVYGNIKDFVHVKYKDNFFTKGEIEFLGNNFGINGIELTDVKGSSIFEDTNINYNITSKLGKSHFESKGSVKNRNVDITVNIPKLNVNDIMPHKDDYGNILVNIFLRYKGDIDNIDYNKLELSAKILGSESNNKLKMSNGELFIKNGKFIVKKINGTFKDSQSSFNMDFVIDKISSKPVASGKIDLKEFELPIINSFAENRILPKAYRQYIKQIKFNKGKINLKADIWNNNVNASTNLGGVSFIYVPLNIPVNVVNGSLYIKKNHLGLNKINLLADDMPILIDGSINNIFSKQNFDIYINSKPQQSFIDKYFNNVHVYPLKIKGDIVYQIKLKGVKDNFELISKTDMAKDSSIYYLGATIGDIENSLLLNLNMDVLNKNIYKIKEFSYDKLIASQGTKQTRLNMLKASGEVDVLKEDIKFNNFNIKTQNPTDARIFNIIFKKPNIKQGRFTSDIKINGLLSNPRILGTFHIFETDIPFMDTTMKNISVIFKDKIVEISSLGEILGNDIKFKGKIRNNCKQPIYIEDAELYTKVIDLNYVTEKLKEAQVGETDNFGQIKNMTLKSFVIKNIRMSANSIRLRNIVADNVEATASLSEKQLLSINRFKFNTASGTIEGGFKYNFSDNNTEITLNAKNIDANSISYAVFDLNNQIYGELTGNMDLSCKGAGFNKCMETLNGNTTFNVSNGRMPKLGSLEYLLKAGNLVKGGLTNISINGIIDIITPMKTGEFDNIYGVISIKDGIAQDIEIATRGKDLSLFITGKYNFSNSIAEMEVLGMLSKKISTLFGPLGNVSLNSLFNIIPWIDLSKDTAIRDKINRIPGIELSSKAYRKFVAEILGNIDGDNYVQTFKWIN